METTDKHVWKIGTWKQDEHDWHLKLRCDECMLCPCARVMIKFYVDGELHEAVTAYKRGKETYPSDHEPLCWGGPKPE